ncbi:MAG: hypothetical protein ACON4U_20855 [Myxococcota bacterium]
MTWTFPRLVRTMLANCQVILLRNKFGTTELRGEDLTIKEHGDWVTISHRTAPAIELRSHMHLRHRLLRYAEVQERKGLTPILAFWPDREQVSTEHKPPLAMMFPTFFNWSDNKSPNIENQTLFQNWVEEYGYRFDLEEETPSQDPFQRYFWGYAFGKGKKDDESVQIVTTDAAVGELFRIGWDNEIGQTKKFRPRYNIHRPHLTPRGEVEEQTLTLHGRDLPDPASLSAIRSVAGSDSAEFWRGITDACGILCFRKKKRRMGLAFSHSELKRMNDLRKLLITLGWQVSEVQQSKAGNHWFDIHDDDVTRFGSFIYTDAGTLHSPQRRVRYERALAQLSEHQID